jgi:hypothetical protein
MTTVNLKFFISDNNFNRNMKYFNKAQQLVSYLENNGQFIKTELLPLGIENFYQFLDDVIIKYKESHTQKTALIEILIEGDEDFSDYFKIYLQKKFSWLKDA